MRSEDIKVLVRLKFFSLDDIISEAIIRAFQLRQGMVIKAKYINASIKGVIVLKSENNVYAVFVFGSFQYTASNDIPKLKPRNPSKLFIIGRIFPRLRRFIKINCEKRPSKLPSVIFMPFCKYFQSWSPIMK